MERLHYIIETNHTKSWEEIIKIAYIQRVSLSASGFWKATDITWDPVSKIGRFCEVKVTELKSIYFLLYLYYSID